MQDHELMIAIPTKNHPKYIMYYLSKTLDDALKNNIDLYIFDASENNDTKIIVERRVSQGYTNLFYKKYPSTTSLEDRLEDIYTRVDYKYIWLCGDGVVLNIRKDIAIVRDEIKKKRDLICFGRDEKYVKEYKEYDNSPEFCLECFAPVTFFGSVVLRGNLVSKKLFAYCKKKYAEHVVPGIYYELFKDGKISAVYIMQLFYDINPYKRVSIAMTEGRTIYAFARLFTETIWKLPEGYNGIKKKLQRWQGGMYEWGHLWSMRVNGNLNLNIYLQNRKYIKIASDTNPFLYWIVLLCPVKLAKYIALIEDKIW